jgi:phosphate/sulfate permease
MRRMRGRMRGRRSVLLWVFVVVVLILLLGLLFGGYRKGTKVGIESTHPHPAYSLTLG